MKPGDYVTLRVYRVDTQPFQTDVWLVGNSHAFNSIDLDPPVGLAALAAARPLLREALKGASTELALRATILLAEIDAHLRMGQRPYKPTLIVVPK